MRDDSNKTPNERKPDDMRTSLWRSGRKGTVWFHIFLYSPISFTLLLLPSLRTHCIYAPNLPFACHVFTLCGHPIFGEFALHGYMGSCPLVLSRLALLGFSMAVSLLFDQTAICSAFWFCITIPLHMRGGLSVVAST
jgi:hypothetical protein